MLNSNYIKNEDISNTILFNKIKIEKAQIIKQFKYQDISKIKLDSFII